METDKNPFLLLVEKAMQTQGRVHMRPVKEKFLLLLERETAAQYNR